MNAPKQHDSGEDEASPTVRAARRALTLGEDVLYVAIAVLLVGGGLVVLVGAGATFLDLGGTSVSSFALRLLDSLLLVFIFVELLAAVKLTLKRREIVAEPFLLVGIVASIKEMVDSSHRRTTMDFRAEGSGAACASRWGASRAAGVAQFRVLRGRLLSSAATSLSRCAGWAARSVPLGK